MTTNQGCTDCQGTDGGYRGPSREGPVVVYHSLLATLNFLEKRGKQIITKVVIEMADGKELKLTVDEAMELCKQLKQMFGVETIGLPYRVDESWQDNVPYKITC